MKFRMRLVQVSCIAAAMTGVIAESTLGQDARRSLISGMSGSGRSSPNVFSIVVNEDVQKDLALTAEQMAKVKVVSDSYRKAAQVVLVERAVGPDMPQEEREKRLAGLQPALNKVAADYKPKLAEAISADQVKRLEGIVLQAKGTRALSEEDVAKALALTDEQKAKIADASKQFRDNVRVAGVASDSEKAQELRRERDEAIMGFLTLDQKDKLASMKGKEFDVSKLQPRRGGNAST